LKLRENHVVTEGRVGTEHGSPYDYDTHVPLIFWGDRIRPARYLEPVRTVDIAPTLAALLGVDAPADVDGDDLSSTIRAGE
jgi:arylsulfatase A-like enzyme